MRKFLLVLFVGVLFSLFPSLVTATSGGGSFIDKIFYSEQKGKVFFPSYYTGGGPGGYSFTSIDLNTKKESQLISSGYRRFDYGDSLFGDENDISIDEIESGFMGDVLRLKEVDLRKIDIDFDVESTLRGEDGKYLSDFVDEDGEVVPYMSVDPFSDDRHFALRVSPSVGGQKRDAFFVYSCVSGGGDVSIRGYDLPGLNKMVVVASTIGECMEYGYIVDNVFIIDGVDIPDEAVIEDVHSSFTEEGFDHDIQPLETGFYYLVDFSDFLDDLSWLYSSAGYSSIVDDCSGDSGGVFDSMKDRTLNVGGGDLSHSLLLEAYDFYEKGEYYFARNLFKNAYDISLNKEETPNLGALYNLALVELKMGDDFHSDLLSHLRELFSYTDNADLFREIILHDSAFKDFSFGDSYYSREYNLYSFIKNSRHYFKDVFSDGEYLYNVDWISGYGNGDLRPDEFINRAEFSKMLVDAFGEKVGNFNVLDKFNDVDVNAWYAGYLARNVELGIVNGYSDGTFRPAGLVTKEDAFKMVSRMNGEDSFSDSDTDERDNDFLTRGEAILLISDYSSEVGSFRYDRPIPVNNVDVYPIGFASYREVRSDDYSVIGAGIKDFGAGKFDLIVFDTTGGKELYRFSMYGNNFDDIWEKNKKFIDRRLGGFDIIQYYGVMFKKHPLGL